MKSGIWPLGFLSYVWEDDEANDKQITALCRHRLSKEIGGLLGYDFPIFHDRSDVTWGQAWRERIDAALEAATFLFPILTPRFFRSDECRRELLQFLHTKNSSGRTCVVMPIYFITVPELDNKTSRKTDDVMNTLASIQRVDWRDLRHEALDSSLVRKTITRCAEQVRDIVHSISNSGKQKLKQLVNSYFDDGPYYEHFIVRTHLHEPAQNEMLGDGTLVTEAGYLSWKSERTYFLQQTQAFPEEMIFKTSNVVDLEVLPLALKHIRFGIEVRSESPTGDKLLYWDIRSALEPTDAEQNAQILLDNGHIEAEVGATERLIMYRVEYIDGILKLGAIAPRVLGQEKLWIVSGSICCFTAPKTFSTSTFVTRLTASKPKCNWAADLRPGASVSQPCHQ
ncbi:MAG: toll/interleukin-1 receptor domain-containing protein [Rhodospirillales bacterium]|nr:toll/interleukin-1 receptor domain-containing protein [Rhodospirillales bacterium]